MAKEPRISRFPVADLIIDSDEMCRDVQVYSRVWEVKQLHRDRSPMPRPSPGLIAWLAVVGLVIGK
ncbi:hypothetical protein SERLA73DRAFT_188121 [Serpula lacrymans var. lacrymans S7.3]|uniref:Uncharacterized protein n=2 Tax=Serpula lacrymans var. lacrymans TaxID=341189 RepID=F8QAS7_SERL3|nr:uncharacterized protein SERLADRAFT_478116 [Serpula lacrymans var. lacrymans S7.9]EGN94313.1 hypothetical protein SERLA73DRAFT_188121 [Serpula lacrymans var. lacrymans S7.3]EGO19802.1 hypothetical protein SERLADRAFT_478116 [Serpula lacrymans var. lacrymans S7.9]